MERRTGREKEKRGREIIQLFPHLVKMAKGGRTKQEAKQPPATIPPLVVVLFLSSSFFVLRANALPLSFIFTTAMGLVAGQPLHNTIQNTHTHCYSQALLCGAKLSGPKCSHNRLNHKAFITNMFIL